MPGGRPPEGKQQRYPELEELALWFRQALVGAGYRSVNEFLARGLFEKNAVYGVFNAARLPPLEYTRALAEALKRNPVQVVPIWTRAKAALDRATLATLRAQAPLVTSWAEIPVSSPALRDLLEAQCASAERLPYELLDVAEPPLSSVYVRQQVRVRVAPERSEREDLTAGRPTAEESPASSGPRLAMSVPHALEQHSHLLVTGEPGAGKSTMSSYLARSLSLLWLREDSAVDPPITEPVVPLRVSARSLTSPSPSSCRHNRTQKLSATTSTSWTPGFVEGCGRRNGPSRCSPSPCGLTGRDTTSAS